MTPLPLEEVQSEASTACGTASQNQLSELGRVKDILRTGVYKPGEKGEVAVRKTSRVMNYMLNSQGDQFVKKRFQ